MTAHRRTFGFLLAGLLVLLTSGCATMRDARRLSWVEKADSQLDCEAAIRRGDLRFYAVNGIASGMVLGTDQHGKDSALIQKHGVRTIEGSSDTGNHRLNQRASEYARAYNAALLRYLHARRREASYKHRLEVASRGGTRRHLQEMFPRIRMDGGLFAISAVVTPSIGESRFEHYRLDREFVLWVTFHDTHYAAQGASATRIISPNAIDALLFGGTPKHHSGREHFVDWRLSYNPQPLQPSDR